VQRELQYHPALLIGVIAMSLKTFRQLTIALSFTALIAHSEAPTQAQNISSVFSQKRHPSVFVTKQDAVLLRSTGLDRLRIGLGYRR
jgi:hypothetical protein